MSNKAAERLRRMMRLNQMPMEWLDNALAAERGNDYATGFRDGRDMERGNHKPDALAAERRATVERIRAEVEGRTWPIDPFTGEPTESRIFTILDKVAAR